LSLICGLTVLFCASNRRINFRSVLARRSGSSRFSFAAISTFSVGPLDGVRGKPSLAAASAAEMEFVDDRVEVVLGGAGFVFASTARESGLR
jgi:hypothetical protein